MEGVLTPSLEKWRGPFCATNYLWKALQGNFDVSLCATQVSGEALWNRYFTAAPRQRLITATQSTDFNRVGRG